MSAARGPERLVPLALGTAILAISFAAPLFRLAAPTHPLAASAIRLALAAVLLSPLVVRAARAGRLDARFARTAALGGVCYALHFGTWVTSLTLTTVAASVTLVTATPLLLAIVAVVTGRDRPDRRLWVSIGLATVGVTLIGWHDLGLSRDALVGDALALAGAAAMAGYMLLGRSLGAGLDVGAFMGIACAVGSLCLVGAGLAVGVAPVAASREAFAVLLAAALLPQLVGHTLLTWALRYARPAVVGMSTVGEPVGATTLALLWLGEPVAGMVAVGCGVTLSAVLLALRRG